MKKILAIIMAAALAAGVLVGCGSSASQDTAAASAVKTVKPGTLTVATSPDFSPFEFYAIDEAGTPTLAGIDIALARYIADHMGLELQIVTVDFDGVLSELSTHSVDLGMSGLAPNPDRESIMDFSDIYYKGEQSLVSLKDNAASITSFEDINSKEFTVGAQIGSIQLDFANEYTPDANIVTMPKVTDIISELIAGKEYAAFIQKDVAQCYQKNYPELELVLDVPYEQNGLAIGVNKGNAELLAAVNEAVAAALEDGSMAQFITDANELAAGEKYEGLLEENGTDSFVKLENFPIVFKYAELFRNGIVVTVLLSVFTVLIGFVLALLLALMRLSNVCPFAFLEKDKKGYVRDGGFLYHLSRFNPLSIIATAYVEIFRSTPVLVQVFIIYYGVFGIIKLPTFSMFGFIQFDRFFPGVVALGLNSAAYLCEIIRSGIQSVDGGQTEAARSLGMSQVMNLRYIILPQAMKNILPAIANEFVVIIKESSITYTIGVQDIMSAVNAVKGATFIIVEPLLVATAIYFCLCFPTSKAIAYLERRMSRGDKR